MDNSGQCSSVAESMTSLNAKLKEDPQISCSSSAKAPPSPRELVSVEVEGAQSVGADNPSPVEHREGEAFLLDDTTKPGSLHESDFEISDATTDSDEPSPHESSQPSPDQSDDEYPDMDEMEFNYCHRSSALDMPSLDPLPLPIELEPRALEPEVNSATAVEETTPLEPSTSGSYDERPKFGKPKDFGHLTNKKKRLRTARSRTLLQQRSKMALAIQAVFNFNITRKQPSGRALGYPGFPGFPGFPPLARKPFRAVEEYGEPPQKVARMNANARRVCGATKGICFEEMLWLWLRRSFLKCWMHLGPYSMMHTPCFDWILNFVRENSVEGTTVKVMGTREVRKRIIPFQHRCFSTDKPSYTAFWVPIPRSPRMGPLNVGCYPVPRSVILELFDGTLCVKHDSCNCFDVENIFKEVPWNVHHKPNECARPRGRPVRARNQFKSEVKRVIISHDVELINHGPSTSQEPPTLDHCIIEGLNPCNPPTFDMTANVDVLTTRIPWLPTLDTIEE